ncbi:hypothetical protein [Acaryochloris marina]|uniref:hypothetical protein n=1 Tax=Acaryochloris marina TaxID=155978 RepID=UPI0021C2A940|nr:hypothetical protein [Acaryochloris marina]BDM82080.1 hypothetical protein AM10699_49440 [Acaryochloris marina MBIC10699]
MSTLETLQQDPGLTELFFAAQWLPEAPKWQKSYLQGEWSERTKEQAAQQFSNYSSFKQPFLDEWETPAADLYKYFVVLTFLLAGYVPGHILLSWVIPELRENSELMQRFKNRAFAPFLLFMDSQWDGLPLVNALGAGTILNPNTRNNPNHSLVRYLSIEEVGNMLDGLLLLSEQGFRTRYKRESRKSDPVPLFDLSEEEELDWLTDYFRIIENYYSNTLRSEKALLLYLS